MTWPTGQLGPVAGPFGNGPSVDDALEAVQSIGRQIAPIAFKISPGLAKMPVSCVPAGHIALMVVAEP